MNDARPRRIAVAGAGSIGCHVGGRLAVAGRDVVFLGRKRICDELAAHGLTVSDHTGRRDTVRAPKCQYDPAGLAGADLVLVAVKSGATAEIADQIAKHAPEATVVSLQNGISNPDILRTALPRAEVRGAVVGYNVIRPVPGEFRQSTSGGIILEDATGDLARILSVPGLEVRPAADIRPELWGKLLVNLNNALNALSGRPLLEQLQDRGWRRLLAAQMSETLAVLAAAGIRPARFTAAPPGLVPHVLRLPTPLFRRVAKAMLTIDPEARSSMQDDLRAGRTTEIDALQGEVLRLAERTGTPCPTVRAVVTAVRRAQEDGAGPPGLQPGALAQP
jgi:2-dehydropantoate 2-reductase